MIAVALAAGCSLITGIGSHAEPALIRLGGQIAELEIPDTVDRNVPFTVRAQTFGGGCTRKPDRTETKAIASGFEIRPYNRTSDSSSCDAILIYLYHTATLTLSAPGIATIAIIGTQRGVSSSPDTEPARLERTIVVR